MQRLWQFSFRRSGVSLSALALPSFSPPKRPNSTAAEFLLLSSFWVSSLSPVAISTMLFACIFKSG
jgi:hypothetical protein